MKNYIYSIIGIIFFLLFAFPLKAQNEFLQKGNTAYEMMSFDEAVVSYSKYLKINPTDKEALVRIANAYEHLNDLENAAIWYDKIIKENVQAEYLFQYGKILMRLGKYEEAKPLFQKYSTLDQLRGSNYAKMCDYAASKKNMMPLFQIESLPTNTDLADYSPTYFKESLVFVSGRNDISRTDAPKPEAGTGRFKNNVFISQLVDGHSMSKPKYLRTWLKDNNGENEGPISYSADGKWVAFVKNKYIDGNSITSYYPSKSNIYIAEVNEKGDWETAEMFPFSGDYSNHFPTLSADGTTMFYSSNQPGGEGGYDLYQTTKKNGTWTTPRNLGKTINKPGNEITPFIDADALYFSSDYQMGFGGYDVFKAKIVENAWQISNMGKGINSPGNDYGFIYKTNENIGFLVSDRDGNEDVFQASKSSNDLNIYVKNAADQKPVAAALLDFRTCNKGTFQTNEEGRFSIKASQGLNCKIKISRQGYEDHTIDLNPASIADGKIEILLFRKGEKFDGSILDGLSNEPVSNVKVKAFNQTDGSNIEAFSDEDGIYSIALKPFSRYMITFSKLEYVDVTIKPQTKDGTDKSILGSLLLYPTSGADVAVTRPTVETPEVIETPPVIVESPVVETPTVPSVPSVPTTLSEDIATPESPSITTPSVPSIVTPSVEEVIVSPTSSAVPETALKTGFSIQLMSLSLSNNKQPNGLSKLQGMVNGVYVKTDDTWKRYRVGVYRTKEEAIQVKAYIRALGFDSAYVVVEDGSGLIEKIDN